MSCWTGVIIAYAIGFLVTPFAWSLVDGWPFAKARVDECDGGAVFLLALFWPLVLVIWGLFVWWTLSSSAGTKAHEAVKRNIERMASDLKKG